MAGGRAVQLSKFLSFVLRHQPESIGLVLNEQGWVEIDELLAKANASGRRITREELLEVVASNDKRRFTLSSDGRRIRAAQGHSVPVDLALAPQVPPAVLYHGTASRFVAAIMAQGLRAQARRQVHLSTDIDTARRVGARHGLPVVLVIDAARMHAAGHVFFVADNGVWLTDRIAPDYLSRLP